MTLIHKTKKEEGKKHNKTQNKKENTKEATNIQNKIEEGQIQDVQPSFKADFDNSGMIQGRFRPVVAVLVAGRYDSMQPIQLDSGRIDPVRRQSKPSGHESKKKKKLRRNIDTRATMSDAAPRVELDSEVLFSQSTTKLPLNDSWYALGF